MPTAPPADLRCTYDPIGRSLWASTADGAIRVRIRLAVYRQLPPPLRELDGRTISLEDLRGRLPPIARADFQVTSHAYPELRADVGEVCVSVLTPQTGEAPRAAGLAVIERWLDEAWG